MNHFKKVSEFTPGETFGGEQEDIVPGRFTRWKPSYFPNGIFIFANSKRTFLSEWTSRSSEFMEYTCNHCSWLSIRGDMVQNIWQEIVSVVLGYFNQFNIRPAFDMGNQTRPLDAAVATTNLSEESSSLLKSVNTVEKYSISPISSIITSLLAGWRNGMSPIKFSKLERSTSYFPTLDRLRVSSWDRMLFSTLTLIRENLEYHSPGFLPYKTR